MEAERLVDDYTMGEEGMLDVGETLLTKSVNPR